MELQKVKLARNIVVGCYFCLNPAKYGIGDHMARRTLYVCEDCSKSFK